jgi:hypothetical protein
MEELIKALIGKTKEDAVSLLTRKGLRFRFIEIDGEVLAVSTDMNPYRVNLKMYKNIGSDITFG